MSEDRPLLVLPNRRCGRVRPGLYLVGRRSPHGTLNAFTAIAAPFEAVIPYNRSYFVIDVPTTLTGGHWLRTDGNAEFGGLPRLGIADLWGKSVGYESVWDIIQETRLLGLTRRVSQIPDIPRPFPVLMMHVDAYFDIPLLSLFMDILNNHEVHVDDMLEDKSWTRLYDKSIGRRGDPDFMDHQYVYLYEMQKVLERTGDWDGILEDCRVEMRQGVFGLSWVTDAVEVLPHDRNHVREDLAERGVLPAVSVDDPRAESGVPIY